MKETLNIEHLRHSLAHLLAAAVLEIYPNTKNTIGPAIDNGFYYDFDFEKPITEEDLPKIEEKMKEILPSWKIFEKIEISPEDAKTIFYDNQYKTELIDEHSGKGEKITLYYSGPKENMPTKEFLLKAKSSQLEAGFLDLCRGGHVENPSKEIDSRAFKLSRIAGAYWRGSEKNKMLTRIYGLAFNTKKELDAYVAQQEEAKKRDHKKIGVELDLFSFSDLVGSGLPLWTPKGTLVRNLLDDYVWELRKEKGYEKVEIPHITKKDLYETSGHWEKYKDDLFRITTREGHEFAMKPMNCPHHTQIYARKKWSYRELPQRYANSTMCYRDEQSGELSGLSRVRAFTQDDAHVFCRMSQVKEEFLKIYEIVEVFYKAFGFNLKLRISKHDPEQPEKYLGDKNNWKITEDMLEEIAKEKGLPAFDGTGEAAFYGPKLDFMAQDAIGREWQVATIQLDMNMPERFDLSCTNEKGEKERVVMIHAAIMGSIERFLSILIEHTAGNFPLWLSPIQVRILPIAEPHHNFARETLNKLLESGIRGELDDSKESLGKKVRATKLEKIPYMLVIGDKDIEAGMVTLESRDNGNLGQISQEKLIEKLNKEIINRN